MRNLLHILGMTGLICSQVYGAATEGGSSPSDKENIGRAAVPAATLAEVLPHTSIAAGAGALPRKAVVRSSSAGDRFKGADGGSIISGFAPRDSDGIRRSGPPSVTASVAASMVPDADLASFAAQLKAAKGRSVELKGQRDAARAESAALQVKIASIAAILGLPPEGDLLAAVAKMSKTQAESEARLASATATHEAEIARLRGEFKAEMEAKDRAHAEALGLLEAQVSTATAALAAKEAEILDEIQSQVIDATKEQTAVVEALQGELAEKVAALKTLEAEAATVTREKASLEEIYKKDIQAIYLRMLTARRDAAQAELTLVTTSAEKQHWMETAYANKSILRGKLPAYDPEKLSDELATKLKGLQDKLAAQIEQISNLMDGASSETVASMMEKSRGPGLTSPLKPTGRKTGSFAGGAVSRRLDSALAEAAAGAGVGTGGRRG